MEIWKEFTVDAAHRLPNVPLDHKCARLHGHTFRIRIYIRGPLEPRLGWVQDFADLTEAWKPLHEAIDHRYLNDVPGLENPTSEHLARWVWQRLKAGLPGLCRVEVQETCTSGCRYEGD